MILALYQKFPFILDRNLAKAKCTENHVCTSCDTVVLGSNPLVLLLFAPFTEGSSAEMPCPFLQKFVLEDMLPECLFCIFIGRNCHNALLATLINHLLQKLYIFND